MQTNVPPMHHKDIGFIFFYIGEFLRNHIPEIVERYFDPSTGECVKDWNANVVSISFHDTPEIVFQPRVLIGSRLPPKFHKVTDSMKSEGWRGRQAVVEAKIPWSEHDHMGGATGMEMLFASLDIPERIKCVSGDGMEIVNLRVPASYGILGGWRLRERETADDATL